VNTALDGVPDLIQPRATSVAMHSATRSRTISRTTATSTPTASTTVPTVPAAAVDGAVNRSLCPAANARYASPAFPVHAAVSMRTAPSSSVRACPTAWATLRQVCAY
jgi:hypothetical protein